MSGCRTRLVAWAAGGLLGLCITQCGGPQAGAPRDPWEEALGHAREVVDGARDTAFESSEDRDVVTVEARYNPASCACPEWEIAFRGRWTRVFLEFAPEDDALRTALAGQATEDAGSDGLGTWWISGRLGDDERLDPNSGMRYPVFTVQELESR